MLRTTDRAATLARAATDSDGLGPLGNSRHAPPMREKIHGGRHRWDGPKITVCQKIFRDGTSWCNCHRCVLRRSDRGEAGDSEMDRVKAREGKTCKRSNITGKTAQTRERAPGNPGVWHTSVDVELFSERCGRNYSPVFGTLLRPPCLGWNARSEGRIFGTRWRGER